MLSFRRVRAGAIGLAMAMLGFSVPAFAQQLSVQAVDVVVSKTGDTAQATFRIAVSNPGDNAVSDVRVVFADGVESFVGDVPAGGKTTGQPETRTLDLNATPTQNVPLKVTVKYQQGDSATADESILVVGVN